MFPLTVEVSPPYLIGEKPFFLLLFSSMVHFSPFSAVQDLLIAYSDPDNLIIYLLLKITKS